MVAGATTFLLKGSMSLDSQSPTAPYESSSFATPQAGAQQPVLYLELLMKKMFNGALLSHRTAGGRWCRRHQRGKSRRKAANHRNAVPADESKGIKLEPASSRNQPEADCLHLYTLRPLPADGYLKANVSSSTCTEILHFVQNDGVGREGCTVTPAAKGGI